MDFRDEIIKACVIVFLWTMLFVAVYKIYGEETPKDTMTVVITTEHEMWTEKDTVACTFVIRSGNVWYIKGLDGNDYWSDKPVRRLR